MGNNLREVRKAKGMTIMELSRRSDIGKSMISYIETGKREPTLTVMCKLADALEADPWEVFWCDR